MELPTLIKQKIKGYIEPAFIYSVMSGSVNKGIFDHLHIKEMIECIWNKLFTHGTQYIQVIKNTNNEYYFKSEHGENQ
jgi:hypothetical protein